MPLHCTAVAVRATAAAAAHASLPYLVVLVVGNVQVIRAGAHNVVRRLLRAQVGPAAGRRSLCTHAAGLKVQAVRELCRIPSLAHGFTLGVYASSWSTRPTRPRSMARPHAACSSTHNQRLRKPHSAPIRNCIHQPVHLPLHPAPSTVATCSPAPTSSSASLSSRSVMSGMSSSLLPPAAPAPPDPPAPAPSMDGTSPLPAEPDAAEPWRVRVRARQRAIGRV